MAMYALAVTPLIRKLRSHEPIVKQIWFADDSSGGGKIISLRRWWQCLLSVGPQMGYFPNSSKTHLVVKSEFEEEAIKVFEGTGIKVTSEGHEMLGSAIGSRDFVKTFTAEKIDVFVNEIEDLAKIAEHYPQSAYAAFSHCIMGKWRYLMRTVEDIDSLFEPLEDSINQVFIPALTGRSQCNADERSFISLPIRYGGLNIINPITNASHEYQSSQKISMPLKDMIVEQRESFSKPQLQSIKASLRQEKKQRMEDMSQQVREQLPPAKQRMMDLLCEKGSSSWLSALPLQDQGFNLNKGEFRDALSLRYGWQLKNTPHYCRCGKSFSTDHAMTCPLGGLPIARHNEIRDVTAQWLNEVCSDVVKEPPLQQLSGEVILPRTANCQDDARLDIRAKGFWNRQQDAFFDVRVFHPNAPSYRNTSIPSLYRQHEMAKKREYGDRIREVEYAVFTPLVFSTTGGMGKETAVAYKHLAELLAEKRKSEYGITLAWMRCILSFALIRSAVTAVRGSRTSVRRDIDTTDIELACKESGLQI
jgi:hypothetical protein